MFFVHPTTYFWRGSWNADVGNCRLNRYTDRSTIRKQATVFNAAARIYAPRYRQATLYSFFDSTAQGNSRQALDLAYTDVRRAFQYYLAHYNQGRPIIIAGHSQGTDHATRLLHEFFDNDPKLRRQLVAAYLIGFKVQPHEYQTIRPCPDSLETGCFVTYNSVSTGNDFPPFQPLRRHQPPHLDHRHPAGPRQPQPGRRQPALQAHRPARNRRQNPRRPALGYAAPQPGGYPRFLLPGELILRHSFHIADYSLFYMNLRENAQARVRAWQRLQHLSQWLIFL